MDKKKSIKMVQCTSTETLRTQHMDAKTPISTYAAVKIQQMEALTAMILTAWLSFCERAHDDILLLTPTTTIELNHSNPHRKSPNTCLGKFP